MLLMLVSDDIVTSTEDNNETTIKVHVNAVKMKMVTKGKDLMVLPKERFCSFNYLSKSQSSRRLRVGLRVEIVAKDSVEIDHRKTEVELTKQETKMGAVLVEGEVADVVSV
jgi:hypothetical protein